MINKPKTAKAEIPAEKEPELLIGQPKAVPGVRRMGRKPLMLVGGIGVLAMGALMYSMSERAASQDRPAATAGKKGKEVKAGPSATSQPEVLVDKQAVGIVQADPTANLIGAGFDPNAPQLVDQHPTAGGAGQVQTVAYQTGGTAPPPAPVQSPYADQWAASIQQASDIRRARFEATRAAAQAESSVQLGRGSGQQQGGQASPLSELTAAMRQAQAMGQGGAPSAGMMMPAALGDGDPNGQASKRGFLNGAPAASNYLASKREQPLSPYELKAGAVINGKMITGINSDLPGQILAMVDRDVFDSATGRYLLIPQGAKLVGTYDNGVTYGQSRVLVAWKRIIYPDGSSLDLGVMPGADRAGYAGLKDKVNNHYARTFGGAAMMSMFAAGIQLSQPQATNGENQSASQTIAAALGQQVGQVGMELARKNLNIQPELKIRPGARVNVVVTKDLVIRPWRR